MKPDEEKYTRRSTLRLRGFDYSARKAYFVTIIAKDRKPVFKNPEFACEVIEILLDLRTKLNFNLYAYCLMPDHFHTIIGGGDSSKSLSEICGSFKSITNRAYWKYGRGKLWQRQFYDHIIRNEEDFFETIHYIKQNPVRKGLVEKWEDWEFTDRIDFLPR
jgi:REP element-mobilizing transposase RayT